MEQKNGAQAPWPSGARQPTTGIYAILDLLAESYAGTVLHLFKHEAAAVRFFSDVASTPDTMIGKHTEDFALYRLGYIDENNLLVAEHQLVFTGKQWQLLQKQETLIGDRHAST